MKLHYSFLLLILITCQFVSAKEKSKYPVTEIPKELLSNADAVIRDASFTYEYQSISKAEKQVYMAITIIKESALDRSILKEHYDSFTKLSDIEMTVYDEFGIKVKRMSQDDILDRSAISGLYEDDRMKILDPKYSKYPFTVVYSYSKKYNSTYHFPNWYVVDGFNLSIQNSVFKVITPSDYNFRYLEQNMPANVIKSANEQTNQYTWEVKDFKAFKYEAMAPPSDLWIPCVMTAPSKFSIEGFEGDLSTWTSFGKFISTLNEGKDNIPEETVNQVKALLSDTMTIYEKIKRVHQYSQQKNRYISIQEGIGGMQPFDAKTVDRLSYGDCKALTNYTLTLLKALNIPCYYTLVQAQYPSNINIDFPYDYFNHAFLCVPTQSDTLWIECTNAHSPCGFIGDFTDDRYVLVIDQDNSKLVKTPVYTAQSNQQSLSAVIQIEKSGDAFGDFTFTYKGAQYPDEFHLTLLDEAERKKRITQAVSAPNFELKSYDIKVDYSQTPQLHKNLKLYLYSYSSKMGDRLLFKVNTINSQSFIPPFSRGRRMPLFIQRNYSENDSIKYQLDESFTIEAIPDPVEINTPFGSYKSSTRIENNAIYYHRYLEINKGTYPKEQYNEFRDFMEKISKADAAKAIIKPSNT